jgi:hypothetical protein
MQTKHDYGSLSPMVIIPLTAWRIMGPINIPKVWTMIN